MKVYTASWWARVYLVDVSFMMLDRRDLRKRSGEVRVPLPGSSDPHSDRLGNESPDAV